MATGSIQLIIPNEGMHTDTQENSNFIKLQKPAY